jgi:hypothetical protein
MQNNHKEIFYVYSGKCLSRLFGPLENHLGGKHFADDEEVEIKMRSA